MKFELKSLPRNCSNEEIIAEIQRVDALVGKEILTTSDFRKHAKISPDTVRNRFGGWEKALIAAGLGHKYAGNVISEKVRRQGSKSLSDEQILQELRAIAKKLDKDSLTQKDVDNNSHIISATTVVGRFGSWPNGLQKAGLKKSPYYRRKFSDDEYFENLLNVWTHYGRQPSYSEMNKPPSIIGCGTYEKHWGTWRKALEAFVKKVNQDDDKNNNTVEQKDAPEQKQPVKQKIENKKPEAPARTEIKKQSFPAEERRAIGLGLRYKVLNRDNFKCVKCGAHPASDPACKLHVDHIIPFSKNGKTVFENLQTLCEKCNLGKGNRH